MTNKEAIRILQTYIEVTGESQSEAIDLAIKALEDIEEWRKLQAVCAFDGYVVYKAKEANDADSN